MTDKTIERTWNPFPHLGFIQQAAHMGEAVLYKHGRGRAEPITIVVLWSKCLCCSSQVRSRFHECFLFLKKISSFYFYHVSLIQCFVPGHKNPETLVGTLQTQIHACNIC